MRSGNGHVCHHCFVSSSPCWRKGPEDKPILCNACGARYLVKRSLAGYFPHARPAIKKDGQTRQKGGHSGRPGSGQAKAAAAIDKRKRKPGKRAGSPSSRNEDVTLVDRGTQTSGHVPLFLPSGQTQDVEARIPEPPSLFMLSPTKHIKAMGEDEFNSFAVSTLTLLRQSESNSDSAEDGTSVQIPVVRRPRKPANAIRALF